jgi:pSer/pThr/pTyr-binding forkhead associated (FHA) protein
MARLIINDGGNQRAFELVDPITVAGRSSENKIAIEDKQCSRRHCQFEKTDWGFKLVDLESRNGTRVNDRVVNQALLRPGDRIQIGKHVLTFEDPNFKEPPAEIAARFGPPSAPVVSSPAPAAGAGKPAPSVADAGAASAPAAGAGPAVAAATEAPPAAEGGPPLRRRSGATTRIERTARFEKMREQKMLTWVAVGAGVFIFILLVLIILPGGSDLPAVSEARSTFERGKKMRDSGQLEAARTELSRIRPDQAQYFGQAQALLRQIEEDLRKREAATSEGEQKEFDALYDFCEKNRANPVAFARMRGECEQFRQKYPQSKFLPKINEYLAVASEGLKASRGKEVSDALLTAQEEIQKNEFASALKRVKTLLDKHNELDVRERIVKVKEEIEDKAKAYFREKDSEAKDLKARGKRDEAVRIYEGLVLAMGDESVEELKQYCDIAKKLLEALK